MVNNRSILKILIAFIFLASCQFQNSETEPEPVVGLAPCKSCPRLQGTDTLAFVAEVVTYISKNADTGLLPNALSDSFYEYPLDELPVQQYLDQFEANTGVASCGLAASLVVKILLDNGIDAYTYSFGFPDVELSHMVALVKVDGDLLVYDPFINYTLTDELGGPLSFEKLLSNPFSEQPVFIPVTDGIMTDLVVDMTLIDSTALMSTASDDCVAWNSGFEQIGNHIYRMKIERSFRAESNRPCSSFVKRLESKLQSRTSLRTFAQAMILKTHPIRGASDHAKVNSALNALIASHSKKWTWSQ